MFDVFKRHAQYSSLRQLKNWDIWFLKGRRGLAGPALRDLILKWESSKSRKHGFGARIFRPSMEAVKRFQPLVPNVDLMSAPIDHCCTSLRKAMFMELTSSW